MSILASVLVLFVGILHLGFMVIEMFYWDKPIGRKIFKMSSEIAQTTKTLAMNQGLYNGFLSTGLFFGVLTQDYKFQLFFLSCVVVAGIFGAFTVNKRILYIQAGPALLALILVLMKTFS